MTTLKLTRFFRSAALIGLAAFPSCMVSFVTFPSPAIAQQSESKPNDKLSPVEQLFENYYQEYLILFPLEATALGDNRYNNLMPARISPDFIAREKSFYEKTLARANAIDSQSLTDLQSLTLEILKYELAIRLEGIQFHNERIPCHQFDGLHLSFAQMGTGTGSHPFKSVKDYDDWIERMQAFAVWSRVAKEQFAQGLKDGYVLPRKLVEKLIPQLLDPTIVTGDPKSSLFFQPILKMPAKFSANDESRLRKQFAETIGSQLIPAYRNLGEYLRDQYLPHTRDTSGIGALDGGKDQYLYWVRYWTTTTLHPDEIHEIGLKEVARIRSEMERVKKQMNFSGDLQSFLTFLRDDPQFMPFKNPEEVIGAFAEIQNKIEPKLGGLFSNRPKTPFEIRRTESFRENTASAEYMPGTADGSRPGIFYTPIPDANKFNITSGMESLFLHEAIPGHHYQISLQQENERLPNFARYLWYGAYGEGWALYCESLGPELGLYSDPRQYMGALNDEIHRAIRLVVDTGMHWKGWTREQAIEYMMANESISEAGTIAEIERYMAVPAQALSYKIGAIKIRELRSKYEKQLGADFSIADFHNSILKDGGMPLNILERRLDQWAKNYRKTPAK